MKPTHEKTNSFLLCMDLQSYNHDCFSNISRTLFDFLNNTYWVSFFSRNSSPIFRTGVSCFSVALFYSTLFCCGGKANLVQFTLFYSTLLALTDLRTDRQRNEFILCGLATLTGSSRLILCGLATLTGSSRLILFGLGNQKKLFPSG